MPLINPYMAEQQKSIHHRPEKTGKFAAKKIPIHATVETRNFTTHHLS